MATRTPAPALTASMHSRGFAFDRYTRERALVYGSHLAGVQTPGEPGLVSMVLTDSPGVPWLREALSRTREQTHPSLEILAVVHASSTDACDLVHDLARHDPRVRPVMRRDTAGRPAVLDGLREARGEFLSWMHAADGMKPDCLARLVADLTQRPTVDMIDTPGSDFFLARRRAVFLLGDGGPFAARREFDDFVMRLDTLLTRRRTHAEEKDLGVPGHATGRYTPPASPHHAHERAGRLELIDDFRRDFCLSRLLWIVDGDATALTEPLERRITHAGHVLHRRDAPLAHMPDLWVPVVHVRAAASVETIGEPFADLPPSALRAAVVLQGRLTTSMPGSWDLCLTMGAEPLPTLPQPYQGWLRALDVDTLFHALDVRAKSHHLTAIEAAIERTAAPALTASVIICTHRSNERVRQAIQSALDQTASPATYEVIVVDNGPLRPDLAETVRALADRHRPQWPDRLRLLACPLPGLSAARNAGLGSARGRIVCLLDDDAVADPHWLERLVAAFDAHPEAGVVGGHVHLKVPDPRPAALRPGWEKYWSQFLTDYAAYTEVSHWRQFPWGANWSARRDALLRIGGFRLRYGRVGDNFWGGEEVVAAALVQRAGYRIAIQPDACVVHDVDPSRFTADHVRKSEIASLCLAYVGRRDGYFPPDNGSGSGLWARVARQFIGPPSAARRDRWKRFALRVYARLRLLELQVSDLRERLRRPPLQSDPADEQ